MRFTLNQLGSLAVAATFLTALASSDGISAAARKAQAAAPIFTSEPVIQQTTRTETSGETVSEPISAAVRTEPLPAVEAAPEETPVESSGERAPTLAQHVADQPQNVALSRELQCLAGAVYFESKSESLAGQLAVGRVIIARAKSGRFPASYCGVVFQRSQFSFVQGGAMPSIDRTSRQWRNAVAIAQIAHANSWRSQAEGALFFHATHVSPGWRMQRIARIDGHVFYR